MALVTGTAPLPPPYRHHTLGCAWLRPRTQSSRYRRQGRLQDQSHTTCGSLPHHSGERMAQACSQAGAFHYHQVCERCRMVVTTPTGALLPATVDSRSCAGLAGSRHCCGRNSTWCAFVRSKRTKSAAILHSQCRRCPHRSHAGRVARRGSDGRKCRHSRGPVAAAEYRRLDAWHSKRARSNHCVVTVSPLAFVSTAGSESGRPNRARLRPNAFSAGSCRPLASQ